MRFIDARAMRRGADYPSLMAHLRDSHLARDLDTGELSMRQTAPTGEVDSVLIRAAWQHGEAMGVKVAGIFPSNLARSLPAVHGIYVLLDGQTGVPEAVLDGTELTLWKTAADSALAASMLAREGASEMLMVGAGALAPCLIRAHCAARPSLTRVTVWNRTRERAEALAASLALDGIRLESIDDLEAGVRRADLVSCATIASNPLVRGEWLRPGQHLDLVGGFTPEMREADDEAVRRARVFVDARETTVEVCGDIRGPIASGALAPDGVEGDLYDLCPAPPERSDGDITLYKNGGGGHLDLMTARYFAARG